MGQSTTPWRNIISVFLRHRNKAVLVFTAIVGVTVLYIAFAPRRYRSEGKLFVRLGRENATLDPTATLGQSPIVAIPQSRDNEINSVVEMLQSRVFLEKVVDALGASKVADTEDRERAVAHVGKRLKVEAAKKSSVIEITYQGSSPKLCQQVVRQLTTSYLEEHARLNRPQGSCEFFREQTDRLRTDLAHREGELRDLKNATGLASPAVRRQQIVSRIARIEDELLHVETARSVAEAKVADLRNKLASLPTTQVTNETSGFGNEGTDRMRDQFYALQVREKEAQSRYTEDHPKMRQIRDQISAARTVLEREEKNRKQVTQEPNRLSQQAQAALLVEEPMLASLQAQSAELKSQFAAVRLELTRLNEDELRIAAVQRDVDLLENDYRKYAANLEQARIDQRLENQRMSNISVVQPASYEAKPIYPRKAISLLLGFLTAGFGAVATVLLCDQLDPSLRNAAAIEKSLQLPTLATIPRLKRRDLTVTGTRSL